MDNAEVERRLSANLHMTVSNFCKFAEGFSFTVATEFEAYKAAYAYRYSSKVQVSEAPNVNAWLVWIGVKYD